MRSFISELENVFIVWLHDGIPLFPLGPLLQLSGGQIGLRRVHT
jgi:hypothetical protein